MRGGIVRVGIRKDQTAALTAAADACGAEELVQSTLHFRGSGVLLAVPFTAAHLLAKQVLEDNSTWKGEPKSKSRHDLARRLALAVSQYAQHPAFRGQGLLGKHWEISFPAWDGGWWPNGGKRTILVPRVRGWGKDHYTEWVPESEPRTTDLIRAFRAIERWADDVEPVDALVRQSVIAQSK